MGRYLLRRLIEVPVIIFILAALTFALVRAAPGGPYTQEKDLPKEIEEQIMKQRHLDEPVHVQFYFYVRDLLRFDLGPSFKYKSFTINELVAKKWGPSLWLGLSAMCIALLVGISSGVLSALKQNTLFDYGSMSFAMLGLSLPTFVVAPALVAVFALWLGWLQVTYTEFWWWEFSLFGAPFGIPRPEALLLPAVSLSFPYTARIARLTRAGMLDVIHQDYIKTARSKGLPEWKVIFRHALRGGLMPVVSFLGPAVAFIMTGSLIVEEIFGLPGLGQEFVRSALNRDYFVTQTLVMLSGTLLVLSNLAVDVMYAFLDPRIRYD